jgi:hypothetical protein
MSDRVRGFTVILERDIRDEDFEAIRQAVLIVKGVAKVEPEIVSGSDHINRQAIKWELRRKVLEVLE